MKSIRSIFIGALAGLVFGLTGGGISSVIIYDQLVDDEYEAESAYEIASSSAMPAVVSIVARQDLSQFYNQFFGVDGLSDPSGELTDVSSGTAFLVSSDGLAVTNKHVVADPNVEYAAILNDGTELSAEVLDLDTLNDIALIQIHLDEGMAALPSLSFANSDELRVGQQVLAIGNALGEYANSTTSGIISAKDRQIVAMSQGNAQRANLVHLLQTDAAINPGNSGGPLIDLDGNVVGMNTAVDVIAEGIGFAIPANEISVVVNSYLENGRIVRPYLGVRYLLLNDYLLSRYELSATHGALVVEDAGAGLYGVFPDSPADKAGIQVGDVILSLNGKDITESFDLTNAVSYYSVGEIVELEVHRDGETLFLDLTLEENLN